MFNPIKRITDSLAQTQEQARQQREKSLQRQSTPKALFDAEDEQGLFVNGDENKSKQSLESAGSKGTEEANTTAEKPDPLPKEIRIKLAKLAKYEDRHPKLQAAYKESQARIVTFEKLLRERTPLTSIDDVDDFGNYLNTLSMRTNVPSLVAFGSQKMSLEELKRVTEANDSLKKEMDNLQKKHQLDSTSQEATINQLHSKLSQFEAETAQKQADNSGDRITAFEAALKDKEIALEKAQEEQSRSKESIDRLQEQIETLEAQVVNNTSADSKLEELRAEKDSMAALITALQASLDQAKEARKAAEASLQAEKGTAEQRISTLQDQKRRAENELAAMTQTQSQKANADFAKFTAPHESQSVSLDTPAPESPTIAQTESGTSSSKKKKKKKKKAGGASVLTTTQELPAAIENEQLPNGYSRRLLEEYLTNMSNSLSSGHLDNLTHTSAQLVDGTPLWSESIARGLLPSQLTSIRTTAESLSKDTEIGTKVEDLEAKLLAFAAKVTTLASQLEEANVNRQTLQSRLDAAESELWDAQKQEKRLLEKNSRLEATSEDVEQLRDMLRDVGSDLVEAKDKLKELQEKERVANLNKSELEATITRLTAESKESHELGKSVEDAQAQAALAESLAATRLVEMSSAKDKLNAVEKELVLLTAELGTVSADKNDLTAKMAVLQTKIRQLERSEKEARETATSIQATLASKEKDITKLRADMSDIEASKARLEDTFRNTKQALFRTESDRNDIQQRERIALEESTRYKRDADVYREKIASLESLRISLTNERNALAEDVQVKATQVESSQTVMQNLREQTTEMGHRAREAKDRCEALEEELSEAHKLLAERAREAGTMRRLLDEAEGREAGRIKEAREKLDIAIEERDHLEEEIALLRRNNAEGSGELTKALREKELEVKDLSSKYEIARHDVEELTKKNADVQARLLQARKELDEATLKLSKLSKSLEEATAQMQQLQQERNAIKEAAEESQIRVEQLQRTQRHLSEELKRLKAAEKKAPPAPSRRESRISLAEPLSPGSPPTGTPRQSISSNGNDPTKAAIDKEYLRNVLVQFFEHKDKRAQLLPVLSMLLNFSKADEMKLLR